MLLPVLLPVTPQDCYSSARAELRRLFVFADARGRARVDRVTDGAQRLQHLLQLGRLELVDEPALHQLQVAREDLLETGQAGFGDDRVRAAAVARAGLTADQAAAV